MTIAVDPHAGPRAVPPFVGREEQVAWLRRSLEDAVAGRPRVALILGEPGIGKTRLLHEVVSHRLARTTSICSSRGYEDMHVPFLAFTQALAPCLRAMPAWLVRALGPDVESVRQLFLPGGALGDDAAEAERQRLLLAVSRAILTLAGRRPMLLVLDDLHWLDQASVDLLVHLVFTMSDAAAHGRVPLCVIGALRPVEATHRLARVIARFQREPICQTLELVGLGEAQVTGLIRGLGVGRPSHQLVAAVNDATRGNPLFVQEVVHHLLRQGAITPHGGFLTTRASALDVPLPVDITAAITARAAELDPQARDVLTLAALLGDPFSLDVLRAVGTTGVQGLRAILADAEQRGLVVGDGRTFQFSHPLVRQVFHAAPSVTARQQLHARIASALTALWGERSGDHVLEVARHVVAAGPAIDPAVVVDVARHAADRAFGSAAWSDAARYYEAALAATSSASIRERAHLHFRAGFAHYREQDAGPCMHHYERAIAAYRECDDVRGLARALMGRTRAQFTLASVGYGELIDPAPLEAVAERIGTSDPVLCGMVWSELAQLFWTARQPERAATMAQRALDVAEREDAAALAAEAHRAFALACSQRLQVPDALGHLEAGLVQARRAGDPWLESQLLQRVPLALTWLGRLDEVAPVVDRGAQLTRTLHDWGDHSLAQGALVCAAVAQGEFDAAERHAQLATTMWYRSGYPWAGPTVLPALACGRAMRGAWAEADDALAILVTPGQVFEQPGDAIQMATHVFRQLVRAAAEPSHVARAEIGERLGPALCSMVGGIADDVYGLGVAAAAVELAEYAGAPAIAAAAYEGLVRATERRVVFSTSWVCLLTRVLGVAATLAGQWEAAAGHFETAVAQARARRARPEVGRAQLGWSRMLVARGRRADRAAASRLARESQRIFRQLGMAPFAAAADAVVRTLDTPQRAPRRHTHPVRTTPAPGMGHALVVLLFTDVEGSTALFDRLGDTEARALLRTHDHLVREWLVRSGGTEIKHTGDGFMASFPSVAVALDCAVGLQRAFAEHTRAHPDRALHVRMGLNAGESLVEDGDLFGAAVTLAARLCRHAQPGQILVADAVRHLAQGLNVAFVDRGRVTLRGFRRRFHVLEVPW